MSKQTIELEVIQCDYVDENGDRCANEGNRESVQICCVCGIDVCESHCDLSIVTSRVLDNKMFVPGQHRHVYPLCAEHVDNLMNLIVEKFGDKYEIPPSHYGGYPGATGTPNAKPIFFNKPSRSSDESF